MSKFDMTWPESQRLDVMRRLAEVGKGRTHNEHRFYLTAIEMVATRPSDSLQSRLEEIEKLLGYQL